MEGLAGAAAVAILLVLLAEGSHRSSEYTIEISNGYYQVVDKQGNVVFAGTEADCEAWIEEHD